MKTVTVQASKTYNIHIGNNLLPTLGLEIAKLGGIRKICLVSETTVYPLYGSMVTKSLEEAGFQVVCFVFPAGEESKNPQVYLELLNFLSENRLTRTDLIVALGGGVVGDLSGFAAATYLRGIRFVQVPTTLLASMDSSVGGKTAIDLPAGKNLVGAFCQPSLVVFDTDVLNSLPPDIFRDGCAEIIKTAILFDPELFVQLQKTGMDFDREAVVTRCVEWKRDVVMQDEFDTSLRMKLNLGHTIGHGVEARSNFTLSHGKSVAIGTAIITRAAAKRGLCSEETCRKILEILQQFGLPIHTEYPLEDIYRYTLSDKKCSGGTVKLIVPNAIGDCSILPVSTEELKSIIEEGL